MGVIEMRTEDGYIIGKCLDGDSAAFGILVDKYKGAIYALAYSRLRNFHDAEDVTQEVFVKAYQKLRILRRWDNFHAWLYAITSNLCKDWIRSRSRRPDREFIEDEDPSILEIRSLDSYSEKRMRQAINESLHEALDSLPEIHRQVLMLFYLGGMSGKEMAAFLGVSPNTIRQRLYRARAQLKEEMLVMMEGTFEAQRLQAGFTIRVVEILKRTRIHAMPRTTGLPWGLSLATGIVLAVLSIGSHINLPDFVEASIAPALSSETAVAEAGEITVDILKIAQTPIISSKQGKGDGREPWPQMQQDAFMLAPYAEGGTWKKRANMSTARLDMRTCVVDGIIYAIGGWKGAASWVLLPTVEAYDPATDTWTRKADIPTRRFGLSVSVVDGIIYAFGGWPRSALSTVEAYDPAKDKWARKADMPTGRDWFSTSVVDGIIYAIGGWDGSSIIPAVEAYDPKTDTWTEKGDMPVPRSGFSACAVDGIIYVVGGQTSTAFTTVEAYDPVTDTWTKKADLPAARCELSATVVNDKIYAIGGASWNGLSAAVEEYDPATDTWTRKPDMPTARLFLSTSTVNGKIYAIGGGTDWDIALEEGIVEEYTPEGWPFSVVPPGKLPTKWGEVKSD
jgi:RNA polymerase sigma factor (sigma-70 family)